MGKIVTCIHCDGTGQTGNYYHGWSSTRGCMVTNDSRGTCGMCKGKGVIDLARYTLKHRCLGCGGKGWYNYDEVRHESSPFPLGRHIKCEDCDGRGYTETVHFGQYER